MLYTFSNSILTNPMSQPIIITHFTGEETEDQRSKVAYPRSHNL